MDILATIANVIPTSLFAGIVAVFITEHRRRSFTTLERKRAVLFRLAAYRYVLTGIASATAPEREGLFSALNEACMVFAKDPQVVSELKRMLDLQKKTDGLLPLMRAMAKAAKIPLSFDDEFFRTPFAPPRAR